MLLVISPNLAVDRVLVLEKFAAGRVHRCRSVLTQAGGKGANLARVYRQLGGAVTLIGFAGRNDATELRRDLASLGIDAEVVEGYDGDTRVCTVITVSDSLPAPTVINEESGTVDSLALDNLLALFERFVSAAEGVVFTGSLSRGLQDNFYRNLVDRVPQRVKFLAIDATGVPLRAASGARRTMLLKPNISEFSELTGVKDLSRLKDPRQIAEIARSHPAHQSTWVVTAGEMGAVLVSAESCWHAAPPEIRTANPIGCGDSFLAGYAWSILSGKDAVSSLRYGVATAASDAGTIRPGVIEPTELEALAGRVVVRELGE